jgi:Asp-tRNA(Asn)/Glu-tRNA(Gln) amidotransferase C subunit
MMNPRDVEHIALLARIALTEAERDRMGKELSAILDYVKTLDALGSRTRFRCRTCTRTSRRPPGCAGRRGLPAA